MPNRLEPVTLSDTDVVLSISFSYRGPTCSIPDENEDGTASPETVALSEVEEIVERVLFELGYQFRHEYAWPDGSLYKYVLCPPSETGYDVIAKLHGELFGHKIIPMRDVHAYTHRRKKEWQDIQVRFARPWNRTFRVDEFVNSMAAVANTSGVAK